MKAHALPIRGLAAVFAAACALVLVFGGVAKAWADEPEAYPLWISGTQVTSENATDVLGDGTVSYDASAKELTLNGASLTAGYFAGEFGYPTSDAGAICTRVEGLDIVLVGENSITAGSELSDGGYVFGIAEGPDVNSAYSIRGEGSLDIDLTPRGDSGMGVYGIYSNSSSIELYRGTRVNISLNCESASGPVTLFGVYCTEFTVQDSSLAVGVEGPSGVAVGCHMMGAMRVNGTSDVDVAVATGDPNFSGYISGITASSSNLRVSDTASVGVHVVGGSQPAINASNVLVENAATLSVYADTINAPAISGNVKLFSRGVLIASANAPALSSTLDLEGHTYKTVYVSDGTTEGEWDGSTPLAGKDSPYTFVRVPTVGVVSRIAGDYANETSAKISEVAFPAGSDWVVIARDDDFADALGATGLAGALDAPIVLTNRFELSPAAAVEIERLKAKHACIIGGTGAIKDQVDADLKALGVAVEPRIWGENSYDTSLACAKKIDEVKGTKSGRVIVAMSTNFQDALSISPVAYRDGTPVILQTWGATSADRGFTDEAKAYLAGKSPLVVGGPGAISDASFEGVIDTDSIFRIYGETGYDTSNEIAKWAVAGNWLTNTGAVIACGAQAPKGTDALAGSALAGKLGVPILLVNSNVQMEGVDLTTLEGYFADNYLLARRVYVLGGTYVIPEDIYGAIEYMLGVSG